MPKGEHKRVNTRYTVLFSNPPPPLPHHPTHLGLAARVGAAREVDADTLRQLQLSIQLLHYLQRETESNRTRPKLSVRKYFIPDACLCKGYIS